MTKGQMVDKAPLFAQRSRWTFRWQMLVANLRPVRTLFDRNYRQPDLTDPSIIESVAADYRKLVSPDDAQHAIPKTIWMLWQQGWDEAPELVRRCAKSWQDQNPGWDVRLLDQKSLLELLPDYEQIAPAQATRQARANFARVMLLARNGGVWADATLFCSRPLDDWLPVAAKSGFFMFAQPRPYRLLDNWFLVSSKGHFMMRGMLELFSQYWSYFNKPHHYFWMIYLIEHMIRSDERAAKDWADTPKLSALGPLILSRHPFNREAPQALNQMVDDAMMPVHKLKHQWRSEDLSGTPLGHLLGLPRL